MRRLLIDNNGDLKKIAPPRLGRLMISAPNVKPYIKAGGKKGYDFFAIGGLEVRGINWPTWIMGLGRKYNDDPNEPRTVVLSLDGFLGQFVICRNGFWVNRRSIIKYVANIAGGVHSGTPKELEDRTLEECSRVGYYWLNNENQASFTLNLGYPTNVQPPAFGYDPKTIEPVLFQLLLSAQFLANSDDIKQLESVIQAELS
jgi:hypothetical protein